MFNGEANIAKFETKRRKKLDNQMNDCSFKTVGEYSKDLVSFVALAATCSLPGAKVRPK